MARTTITRRGPAPIMPYIPAPLFSMTGFPSLTRVAEEFSNRADEMMRAAFADAPEFPVTRFPLLNVSEAKNEFIVTAELPGMTAKDVTVDFCDGVLTIEGEKEEEKTKDEDGRKYHIWERRFGSFQRSLPFPGGVNDEKIAAEFKDGVLTVHLPKAEQMKTKHRPITVAEK
jgi:HSP20 family protein